MIERQGSGRRTHQRGRFYSEDSQRRYRRGFHEGAAPTKVPPTLIRPNMIRMGKGNITEDNSELNQRQCFVRGWSGYSVVSANQPSEDEFEANLAYGVEIFLYENEDGAESDWLNPIAKYFWSPRKTAWLPSKQPETSNK